jgi:hypothetical protein
MASRCGATILIADWIELLTVLVGRAARIHFAIHGLQENDSDS